MVLVTVLLMVIVEGGLVVVTVLVEVTGGPVIVLVEVEMDVEVTGSGVEVTVLVEVSVVVLTDVSVVVVGVGFIGQSEFEKKTEKLYSRGKHIDNSQHKLLGNHMIANVVVIPVESWSVSDSAPNPASLKAAT